MKTHVIKKLLTFTCAAALLLTGCSGIQTDDGSVGAGTAPVSEASSGKDPYTEPVKIGFIPNVIGDSVAAAWIDGMERELANFDTVSFQTYDGEASVDTQVKIIDDLINQDYDAIILQATDAAGLAGSVKKAEAAGIPVITMNLDADTPHASLIAMVDYEGGKQVAHTMAQKIGGTGNVVIISATPGASKGENISRGFKEVMQNDYPGITILDEQTGEWLTENAYTVMNDFLTKHPQIDGVLCHNDAMAEGAAEAARAAGRLEGIQIWGMDGEQKMLEYIEQGLCAGTIFTNCKDQGAMAARMAIYHISAGVRASDKTPVIKMAPIVVTPENVAEITDDMRW